MTDRLWFPLIQPRLSVNGKPKNPIVVQSKRLDFSIHQDPGKVICNTNESNGKQARSTNFLACPSYRLPPKGVAQTNGGSYHLKSSLLKVSFPVQMTQLRKIPHRFTQPPGF